MLNSTKNIFTSFKFIDEKKQELKNFINEELEMNEKASDLRNVAISKLGWREKGNELSNGGELNTEFTSILNELISQYNQSNPNCKGTFTAGNDKYHQNIKSYKSKHSTGQAVDVVLNAECHSSFPNILNQFIQKYPGFSYINEYTNPSAKSTGGHFHISYSKGSPETKSTYDTTKETGIGTDKMGTSSSNSDGVPMKHDPILYQRAVNYFTKKGMGESSDNSKNLISEGITLGKNIQYSRSSAIIPQSSNNRIKSPIDGKIDNIKYISGCENQLSIRSTDKKNYLVYCGISTPKVDDGDNVSEGDLIGVTDSDVKVTLYDSRFNPLKLSSDTKIGDKDKNKKPQDIKKGYHDPIIGVLASPVKSFKHLFGLGKKDEYGNPIEENISRIKSLLK